MLPSPSFRIQQGSDPNRSRGRPRVRPPEQRRAPKPPLLQSPAACAPPWRGRAASRSCNGPAMTSTAELTSPASANTPLIGVRDRDYTLEHKYTRTDGRIYLSGVQALVRLPLMQQQRDAAAGQIGRASCRDRVDGADEAGG